MKAVILNENNDCFEQVWLRISAFLSQKSANTQKTYLGIVKEWAEFLGAQAGSPSAARLIINADDLKAIAYLNFLKSKIGQKPRNNQRSKSQARASKEVLNTKTIKKQKLKFNDGLAESLSNATIAKKIAALRRIYRMLLTCDFGIKHNPFDVDRVSVPSSKSGQKRPTEMVYFEQVKKILSLPNMTEAKGLRDKTILALLFGAGLRRSEVSKLRLADLNKTEQGTSYLYLRATKAKKDAKQAVPNWAADLLWSLLKLRQTQGALAGDFLFISYRGPQGAIATNQAISDSGIYKLFKRYCLLAGAGEYLSPHSARATAITKLLADGVDHRLVQEFSRHSSIQMVETYDKRRVGVDSNPAKDLDY